MYSGYIMLKHEWGIYFIDLGAIETGHKMIAAMMTSQRQVQFHQSHGNINLV